MLGQNFNGPLALDFCVCVDEACFRVHCRVYVVFFSLAFIPGKPISWFAFWCVFAWKRPRGETHPMGQKLGNVALQHARQQQASSPLCRQHLVRTYSVHNKLGLSLWQAAFCGGEDQRHACVPRPPPSRARLQSTSFGEHHSSRPPCIIFFNVKSTLSKKQIYGLTE